MSCKETSGSTDVVDLLDFFLAFSSGNVKGDVMRDRWYYLAILFVLIAGCAMARYGGWTKAQKLFSAGKYEAAIREADALLFYGTPSHEERARTNLLKAQCYENLDQLEQAIALYAFIAKEFPGTAEGYQAKLALARLIGSAPAPTSEQSEPWF